MERSSHDPPRSDDARISSERLYQEKMKTARETRGSISTGRWMWEWMKAIATAIVLFLAVRTFVVEAFKIPTGSMENTLLIGDFLLVNKAVYGAELPFGHIRTPALTQPRRGDVIVFLPPHDPGKNYVKRLVGLPGDTLEMRDKVLHLNGEPLDEPHARYIDPFSDPADPRMMWQTEYLVAGKRDPRAYRPTRDNWGPVVVPDDRFYVLGDNRDNSEDSRYWGFVDADAVRGRPMFVYYSFRPDPRQPFGWITSVRWDRVGGGIR
jgi:signal peptidase I